MNRQGDYDRLLVQQNAACMQMSYFNQSQMAGLGVLSNYGNYLKKERTYKDDIADMEKELKAYLEIGIGE